MLSPMRIQWEVQLSTELSIQHKGPSYKKCGHYNHTPALHLRKRTMTSFVLMSVAKGQRFPSYMTFNWPLSCKKRGDTNKNIMQVTMTENYLSC